MHKTLKELELALTPLIKLIPKRKLQVEVITGYIHGKRAYTTWDVLDIIKYQVLKSDFEKDRYFSVVDVKVTWGEYKANFDELIIKQPDPKILITDLVKAIELWAEDGQGFHSDTWEAYIKAKKYLDPTWEPK